MFFFIDKELKVWYYLITENPKKVLTGGTVMDALKEVLDTIKKVLALIKEFFEDIFPKSDEEAAQ